MQSSGQIRRIILCADGDSSDIDLWSNIPYLLGVEIERRKIELIRVNLEVPWFIRRAWRFSLGISYKLRHWNTSIDFYRSNVNHWIATRRLNRAVRSYGGAGSILINLSISSAPTLRTIPLVLLSDWSYEHYITNRLGRQPDPAELRTIARDNDAMARASLVVLLFPESAARLQRQIPNGRFCFLGHVINNHPLAPPLPLQPPAAFPHRPWRLLFVGRPRYREGLEQVLFSLSLLPPDLDVQLDVIGMEWTELPQIPCSSHIVHMHGYLSKADATDRATYYQLLNHADLIVNASERWGGFSATIEAMHRRTAVLTARYSEFQALFGSNLLFGAYLADLTPATIASAIAQLFQDSEQLFRRQNAAHAAVSGFTWKAFCDKLLANLAALPYVPN